LCIPDNNNLVRRIRHVIVRKLIISCCIVDAAGGFDGEFLISLRVKL
jgi:hypothetical protein